MRKKQLCRAVQYLALHNSLKKDKKLNNNMDIYDSNYLPTIIEEDSKKQLRHAAYLSKSSSLSPITEIGLNKSSGKSCKDIINPFIETSSENTSSKFITVNQTLYTDNSDYKEPRRTAHLFISPSL